jgi:hypothetical protein
MGKRPEARKAKPAEGGRGQARWIDEAVRLLAGGQATDVAHACRKAAERLGIARGARAPSAVEIIEALVVHQRLFGGVHHEASLAAVRGATCEAMRALAPFSPLAVGGVVDGSHIPHANINLVAYCDDELAVMHHLAERGIPTATGESGMRSRHGGRGARHPELRFRAGPHGFAVTILPAGARGHALLDHQGNTVSARADFATMERVLVVG